MAKQKPIIEDLLALLPADKATELRKTLESHPEIAARAVKEAELSNIYNGFEDDEPPVAAAAVHVPTLPSAAAAPVPVASATGNDDLKAMISTLSTSLDDRFKKVTQEMSAKASEVIATAVKVADNYAQVREDHRAEFGEQLNRNEFEKFIALHPKGTWMDDPADTANGKTGMAKAHDAFVAAKRTERQIKEGVDAGVKQVLSSRTVPGQTQTVSLSPAAQVMAKAREGAGSGAKSNALAAAERLASLVKQREGSEVVQ